MNQTAIIRRAWELLRRFKVLWLFGILVALTSSGSGSGGNGMNFAFNGEDFDRTPFRDWSGFQGWDMPNWDLPNWRVPDSWPALVALCCCLLFILVIVGVIINYVSRAALIRSANQIEETGAAPTWRAGFRLGWTNRTFRLWLLELVVGIIVGVGALLLLALAASPLLLLLTETDAGRVTGIVLTVILGLVVVLFLVVVALILSVVTEFWSRAILLDDAGIGDALARGLALARSRARDVGIMWLLMLGIGIGFGVVLIPVVLLVLALAGGVGGGLGYLLYSLTESVPWAVALGLPLFVLIMLIPLTLISGLYTVFTSNVWTLTYREVTGRSLPPAPASEPAPAADSAAVEGKL